MDLENQGDKSLVPKALSVHRLQEGVRQSQAAGTGARIDQGPRRQLITRGWGRRQGCCVHECGGGGGGSGPGDPGQLQGEVG